MSGQGGGRRDNGDAVGAGLSFPLSEFLVSLGEEEKTVGRSRGDIGRLG